MFLIKLYIGLSTNSLCIYTDGINNLGDFFCSIIALVGFLLIGLAPTKKHPFGFGMGETIAEFIMSVIITLVGFYFAYSAFERLLYPTPISFSLKYVVIIVSTAVFKILMGFFFLYIYKKTNSVIIKTMYIDSFMDVGITLMTIMSFCFSNFAGIRIDAIFGLVISLIIIINGIKLVISSFSLLIGEENVELQNLIIKEVEENGLKIIDIKIHNYGNEKSFAVIKVKNENSLENINTVVLSLKENVKSKFGAELAVEFENK